MAPTPAPDIDTYTADFAPEVQERMEQIRALVHKLAPEATEAISYGIPTFDLNGSHLVHYAGFAKHIGLYPTPTGMSEFAEELSHYKTGKGSAQFPHDKPLPMDLIERIVRFRIEEVAK